MPAYSHDLLSEKSISSLATGCCMLCILRGLTLTLRKLRRTETYLLKLKFQELHTIRSNNQPIVAELESITRSHRSMIFRELGVFFSYVGLQKSERVTKSIVMENVYGQDNPMLLSIG